MFLRDQTPLNAKKALNTSIMKLIRLYHVAQGYGVFLFEYCAVTVSLFDFLAVVTYSTLHSSRSNFSDGMSLCRRYVFSLAQVWHFIRALDIFSIPTKCASHMYTATSFSFVHGLRSCSHRSNFSTCTTCEAGESIGWYYHVGV